MDVKSLADEYEDYIVERRRYYHMHPELSGEEVNTRESIKNDLLNIGISDIREMTNCNGLIAQIHGKLPGKTVALRADIDALCVNEETNLPFASTIPGKMHACGHDAHISILLGAAKILNNMKDELTGTVRLIVQPEEEIAQGAKNMIAEGALENVDALYGGHVWSTLDAPKIDFGYGNRMASCHSFEIEVFGESAHGSAPQRGIDAVVVATAIVNTLQQCVSRQNDPLNPLVMTIGTIEGGTRFNVIANKVTMTGNVRTFRNDTDMEDKMRRIISTTAEGLGARAELKYHYLTKPVINSDEKLLEIARNAVINLYGSESLGKIPTEMAGEDFSEYGSVGIPYVWGFIGSHNPNDTNTYNNHHEKYTVDESILKRASAVMAQFAIDYLTENNI